MSDEKTERAEGVSRMMKGEDAPEETDRPGQTGPTGGGGGEMSPEGVGESVGRQGNQPEASEAGRDDVGTDDTAANRPVGTSTSRDSSGVDPQEPTA